MYTCYLLYVSCCLFVLPRLPERFLKHVFVYRCSIVYVRFNVLLFMISLFAPSAPPSGAVFECLCSVLGNLH